MSFLPDNYEKPSSDSKYMKLQQGNNKFRILSKAITGYIDWDKSGEKPVPVRTKEKLKPLGIDKVKHFWAFIAFDYNERAIKILEVTQVSIQDFIFSLHNDSNWGDPLNYDLNIVREGEKMETKYSGVPTPPKPLDEEIKKLYESMTINLSVLFEGGDPFEAESSKTSPQGTQGVTDHRESMQIGKQKASNDFPTEEAVPMPVDDVMPEEDINVSSIPF